MDLSAQVRLIAHRGLNRVLPLVLGASQRWARSGYDRLLAGYRLDYLQQQRLHPGGVTYRLLQTRRVSPTASTYVLQAPAGVAHEPEDNLLLRWQYGDDEVHAVLVRQGWRGDERLRLRDGDSAYTPGGWLQTDVRSALRDFIDLRSLPAELPRQPVSAVARWPRQRPRSYTVSAIEASPRGDQVEIIVSDVLGPAPGGGTRPGRCSGYLAQLQAGAPLRGWPLAAPLALQRPGALRAAPLLVVATGIAAAGPLLALPHVPAERPVWLICGLRQADLQQPFTRQLLAAAQRPGLRLDIALSRDDAPAAGSTAAAVHWFAHQRVQQVLHDQADALARLLAAGGDIVVIGHTSMGDAVRDELRRVLVAQGQASDDAAAVPVLQQLEASLRVQYSLSGR